VKALDRMRLPEQSCLSAKWVFSGGSSMILLTGLLALSATVAPRPSPLPAETVAAFYRAANRAAYGEAETYFTAEALEAIKNGPEQGFREFCNAQTADRTVERIEVLKQEVRGDVAEVRVELYFSAGLALHRGGLVRRNGVWKINTFGS
jgi:hypothetical protein